MKYLVLGSSGQIGDCLVSFLRNKGHSVCEFDIVRNDLEDLRINNNKILEQAIRDTDFVFFLAFFSLFSHVGNLCISNVFDTWCMSCLHVSNIYILNIFGT